MSIACTAGKQTHTHTLTVSDNMVPLLVPGVRGMERPEEWNRIGKR